MHRRTALALFLAATFAALAPAQTKPNFTGTWKLNLAKSDFGILPAPEGRTDIIDQSDTMIKDAVNASTAQGKQVYVVNYSVEGKETVNKLGPNTMKATANWSGSSLAVDLKLAMGDQDITGKSVWTLSDDGKSMTQTVHYVSAMGEADQKFVFDKTSDSSAMPSASAAPMPKTTPDAASGPHPDFSGVWKLIVAKSDFGVLPPPESRTDTIVQTAEGVKLTRKEVGPQGNMDYTMTMVDGKETPNSFGGGAEAKITSSWEGASHVDLIKLNVQGQDITIRRVSALSADGKTLTATSHITSAMGEMDQTEIYEKQ